MKFGVGLPLEAPVSSLVELAREIEDLGYDYLWGNDERLERDVYSVLSVIARETRRLHLGPGVTNPYSRHPALTAVAIATLDEVSDRRAVLGIGAGGTNHAVMGIRREHPATAVHEAIRIIRSLLAGGEITLEGQVVRVYHGRLDFTPVRRSVPIYIGGRGPRILELAGEVADGIIVGNVSTVEGWRYAMACATAGVRRAGRRLEDLECVAWVYTSIADEGADAVDAIRPMVATSLVTSRAILDRLGVTMPARFADVMRAQGWSLSRSAVTRAAGEIPADVARRFGLAGTSVECVGQLQELLRAFPQISQVVIVPFGPRGRGPGDVIRRFIEEVVSRVA